MVMVMTIPVPALRLALGVVKMAVKAAVMCMSHGNRYRSRHIVIQDISAQPFTAAAVSPRMKYRWKKANRQAMGRVATVEAAIAAAHIGGRE